MNVFDIANSVRDSTRVCTREEFERMLDSSEVANICKEISLTPTPSPEGEGSPEYREWKDTIAPLKKRLPVLLPHAHFIDRHRSNKSGVSSPWVSSDFDGIHDPLEFWEKRIAPRVEELRVVLAFISPSGKGIKIVSQLPEGMTREKAQEWFAKEIGLSEWDHTHELARCVYLVPRSYLLCYKPSLLFNEKVEAFEVKSERVASPQPSPKGEGANNGDGKKSLPSGGDLEGASYDPTLKLGDLLYSDIAHAFFRKKNKGMMPKVGERHATLVSWVNAAYGMICDNNMELMLKATPRLGKPEAEVEDIVRHVDRYHSRNFTPRESKLLKQVIAELRAKQLAEQRSSDDDLLDEENQEKLPPLPPPIKALVDICPPDFKAPMVILALTMFGELLCRFRAKLNEWEIEFPGFFYVFEAQAGGGKRFINIAKSLILDIAKAHDKEQEDIYNKWSDEKEQHENDDKYVAPPRPKPIYMIGPDKFSPSELMKEAMNNQGVGILTISEEIDTHSNANKGGPSRDTSDMERIGWDGGQIKQRYAGQGTVYGTADLFLSFIFTGTPKAIDRAFPDAENGLVSRYIYDNVNNSFKGKPKFRAMPEKNMRMIKQYAEKAIQTCFDEEGKVRPIQMMNLDWALPAIEEWAEDYLHLAQVTRNIALDAFRRRPPKMAFRAMIVANWLWGCKKKHRQDVIDFGIWLADHAIDSQMKRFGNSFAEQVKVVSKAEMQSVKQCRSEMLLQSLPDVFTTENLDEAKATVGLDSQARKIICRLKAKNLIEKIDTNTYRKIQGINICNY